MKKKNGPKLLLALLLTSALSGLVAKESAATGDRITLSYRKNFWGLTFYINTQEVERRQFLSVFEASPRARDKFASGLATFDWAQIVGGVGGGCLGVPLGLAAAGSQNPMWGIALGGVALITLSFYMQNTAFNNFDQALILYRDSRIYDPSDLSVENGHHQQPWLCWRFHF